MLWNAAGSSTAITLKVNKDEFSCTTPATSQNGRIFPSGGYKRARPVYEPIPKPCSEKRVPPAKKHVPSTNTTGSHVSQIGGDRCSSRCSHKLFKIKPTTMKMGRSVTSTKEFMQKKGTRGWSSTATQGTCPGCGELGRQPIRYGEECIGITCDNSCRNVLIQLYRG